MIGHQHPGIDRRPCFQGDIAHPAHKKVTVVIIDNDFPFFDSTYDHMVQRAWCIKSRTSWHIGDDWFLEIIKKLLRSIQT